LNEKRFCPENFSGVYRAIVEKNVMRRGETI